MQAVINAATAPLTTNPALWAQNPQQSRLVDELLLGMPVEITGEAEQHMVPVRTFYGYTGLRKGSGYGNSSRTAG